MTALAEPRTVDRQRMVERYIPLADKLARRYRDTSEPIDDLVQVARLGLVKAVDRWDPGRGTAFSTFAVPTILGELRRHFRDRTWTSKPPRDLQDLYLPVHRVRQDLAPALGREPTARDVADRVGRTPEEVVEALAVGEAHSPASLDAPVGDDEAHSRIDTLADRRPEIACSEQRTALQQLGRSLSDRDREVVRLRFEEDLMQREIGDRIGVSQMQVSRILRNAIARLRAAAEQADVSFER